MRSGSSCQSSVRGKDKLVTKKRRPMKKGGVKTMKRHMSGGKNPFKKLFGRKLKKSLPEQSRSPENVNCDDFVIIIREASEKSKKENEEHTHTIEISQKNVDGTCKYKIFNKDNTLQFEIPKKKERECVKSNKKLLGMLNYLASQEISNRKFNKLEEIENALKEAITKFCEIEDVVDEVPNRRQSQSSSSSSNYANLRGPNTSTREAEYLDVGLASPNQPDNTYMVVGPAPDSASSSGSRDSGHISLTSASPSPSTSPSYTYADPQDALRSASTSASAPASPPKKSKLDRILKEYDEVSINTFYDIISYIIDHINDYNFIDNADKIKKKRGEEILNELKKTNEYVSKVDPRETHMNFLTGLKLSLSKNKNTEGSSNLMEWVISELNLFITIFDKISLNKIAKILNLLDELEKLDIKQLPYNEFKKKNQEEVKKQKKFYTYLEGKYPKIRHPYLVVNNPGKVLFQKLLKFQPLLTELSKRLEDEDKIKAIIEKINALVSERYQRFNKERGCYTDVSKVLNEGGDIDVKECFDGPEPLITNMKRGWGDDNGLCSKLKKKTEGINHLKTKKRKKFKDALKTNCESNLDKREVRKSQIQHHRIIRTKPVRSTRRTKPVRSTRRKKPVDHLLRELKRKLSEKRSSSRRSS